MKFTPNPTSNILYIILIDDYSTVIPFVPPDNVNPISLDYIKFLPKNYYQLTDPLLYLSYSINYLQSNPYSLLFLNRSNFEEINQILSATESIVIFITDFSKDIDLKTNVRKLKDKLIYFLDVNDKFSANEKINNLINEINSDSDVIEKHLNINRDTKVDSSIENQLENYNYFKATKNNFLSYNTSLGNFNYPYDISDDKIIEHSTEAIKERETFNRLNLFIEQLLAFDTLHSKLKKTRSPKKYDTEFNPIYIAIPFHNPDIDVFFPKLKGRLKKEIIAAMQVEQNSNYINQITIKEDEDEASKLKLYNETMIFLKQRLAFLDSSSFLNSSFNFAPYVRLPILGKSVYRELSFIGPKNFEKFLSLKSQLKLSSTISKIGNNISQSIFSKEFRNYISHRNSQIVSITDLPVEWIEIDGVPLSFSHDITRLPETNFNNHLNSFVLNSSFAFKIEKDIITRTLVILGTNEPKFLKWYDLLNDKSKQEKFNVEICLNIEDFLNVIKQYSPDFLIIDTHGGFDEETKQTYLKIGQERLTQEVILANEIIVPLVFLSACGTAPTYGTFNPIANAFLQIGSKSVTSTYMPVEINNATMIYLQILDNLNNAANEGTFKNWLEYMSYNIRSTYIHRIYSPLIMNGTKRKWKIDTTSMHKIYRTLESEEKYIRK